MFATWLSSLTVSGTHSRSGQKVFLIFFYSCVVLHCSCVFYQVSGSLLPKDFRIIEFAAAWYKGKFIFLHLQFVKKEIEIQKSEHSQVLIELETVSPFPNFNQIRIISSSEGRITVCLTTVNKPF